MYVKRNNEERSRDYFYRRKARIITYSEYVSVALFIQHAKRMRRIILSSVVCSALLYFSILSRNRHDFGETLLNKKCVVLFSLQLFSEKILIIRRIRGDIFINVRRSSCKVPLYFSEF